jgi:hypothetical protein
MSLACANSTTTRSDTQVKSIARSSTSVPSAAEPRTCVSRASSQGRASSPMRNGRTLIAMNASAVARNSGRSGSFSGASESASQRQRTARTHSPAMCAGTMHSTIQSRASAICEPT